jgi:hypothetical protein
MRRRLLALGGAVMLAVAACSSGSHRSSPPTTVPVTSTSAVPVAGGPNPDVVPPVITVAYVNAVFAALNHINGNAARLLVDDGQFTNNVRSILRAIYNDPLYEVEVRVFEQSLTNQLSNVRRPPGDRVTVVMHLLTASPKCIFVSTHSDLSAVQVTPTRAAASEYWELQPKQPGADPTRVNPTPWALSFNQAFITPTRIPTKC